MRALSRREALHGLTMLGAGSWAGCVKPGADSTPAADTGGCITPSTGTSVGYCIVEKLVIRLTGAALILPGESMIGGIDDNTAVIVARDAAGFFARSAICTHACCIVSLCDGETCTTMLPGPDPCGTVGPTTGDRVLCPCHGSVFRVSDGVALAGPATTPLPAYAVTVDGDDVLVDSGTEVGAEVRVSS